FLIPHVWFSKNHQWRPLLSVKEPFHRGKPPRLVRRNLLSLHVARGKELKKSCNHSNNTPGAYKGLPVCFVALRHQVERADSSHYETTGLYCADHVVRVLPKHPWIQEQGPEARKKNLAVWSNDITNRVLHPCI